MSLETWVSAGRLGVNGGEEKPRRVTATSRLPGGGGAGRESRRDLIRAPKEAQCADLECPLHEKSALCMEGHRLPGHRHWPSFYLWTRGG